MMIATQCPSAEELRALSTGRLADQRSEELLEHLRGCDACRSAMETVADGEDSLIASLRAPEPAESYDREPGCRMAVAKALGALAFVGDTAANTNHRDLPKTLGEYEIVRPLGSGGMGSVFLARHTKLGREVAVKVLAGHRLADPRMRERFDAEMRAVGKLSHPNIVTAHDAREVDGTAVLVTEFIDGFDLGQLVARTGPLKIADACEIVRQVALALAYTSRQGFVHRDVKPSNVMLSRSGEVKVLDLGLARFQFGELEQVGMTGTGQTMGTADYIAPEQVADSRSVDVRADLYSLGCSLFHLLCGSAPFADGEHATAFAKMTAHVSESAPNLADRLPDAPPALVKLIAAMLAKDPAKRPQDPLVVAERLAPFTQGSDLEQLAARASALEPTRSPPTVEHPNKRPSAPGTLPLLRRMIPLWIALASGIAGIFLGVVLGILITIEYPDGTVVSLEAPAGSKVTVEDPTGGKPAPDSVQTAPVNAASAPPPLQFAMLIDEGMGLDFSNQWLLPSHQMGPAVTDIGTWYPLSANASDLSIPTIQHHGQRYARVSHYSPATIGWAEIEGHLAVNVLNRDGQTLIEFNLDEGLFAKISELAQTFRHRPLAIIVNNEIVAAPPMSSELGRTWAILSGNFTDRQIESLLAAVGGPLAGPTPENREVQVDENAAAEPVEALQGLWQVVDRSIVGMDLGDITKSESVWAFAGTNYYTSDAKFLRGGGTYWARREGVNATIDFRDELSREKQLPILRGIYRLRPDGRLEMVASLLPQDPRPSSFDVDKPPFPISVYILERLGDLPDSETDLRAMTEGKSKELREAIVTTVESATYFPKSLEAPTLDEITIAAKQDQTREKLKAIGLAFHNFHDVFKKLPGTKNQRDGARTPADGKPIQPFSWRLAILPFIGELELYEQYRFEEPWDSDHNRELLSKMPTVYQSPFGLDPKTPIPVGETHYQGFVGEQTALGVGEGLPFREFTDGTSPTLLIVESQASVPWTKPQDLPFEKPEDAQKVLPFESVPLNFLTVDGAVHKMDPVDAEKLAKLITRNGGERVRP